VDEKDDVAAVGLPAGWDAVVEQGVDDLDQGRPPSALSALSVTVARERLGQGLSGLVLQALKRTAAAAGLERLVVPVRPTAKSAYPLTPMERYIRWRRPDGAPFDFWLRTHCRLGARVLAVCPASMVVTADVATWEEWTAMQFPESGDYVVPEALVPVQIDRTLDLGRYVEPNIWVEHSRTSS